MYDKKLTIEQNLTLLAAAPSRIANLTQAYITAVASRSLVSCGNGDRGG